MIKHMSSLVSDDLANPGFGLLVARRTLGGQTFPHRGGLAVGLQTTQAKLSQYPFYLAAQPFARRGSQVR